jgi:DNA-binding transcriptional regulator GbsR (MarR family)
MGFSQEKKTITIEEIVELIQVSMLMSSTGILEIKTKNEVEKSQVPASKRREFEKEE